MHWSVLSPGPAPHILGFCHASTAFLSRRARYSVTFLAPRSELQGARRVLWSRCASSLLQRLQDDGRETNSRLAPRVQGRFYFGPRLQLSGMLAQSSTADRLILWKGKRWSLFVLSASPSWTNQWAKASLQCWMGRWFIFISVHHKSSDSIKTFDYFPTYRLCLVTRAKLEQAMQLLASRGIFTSTLGVGGGSAENERHTQRPLGCKWKWWTLLGYLTLFQYLQNQ